MKKLYLILALIFISNLSVAQPANDDCANAQIISVSTTNLNVSFDTYTATINNEEGCSGTIADYADVWYEFTMPTNGNLYIDGILSWNQFAIYDACNGTEISCFSNNAFLDNLVSGTTYKLRVYRTASNATTTSYQYFNIIAYNTPTNDDCSMSENITLSSNTATVNFEIAGAQINNEVGCTGTTNDYLDIWYDFTMPFDGNLYIDGSISWNNFALYDACNGTEIQCGSSNLFIESLSASTNYKIRVFRTLANASANSYKSFYINAYPTALNDDCASAENITVSTSASTVNFEIAGAEINNEEGCTGTTNNYLDIWYDFTMPVNGNLYIDGSIGWNNFALYDTCGGTQIQCGSANQFIENLSSGTTYKLRVFRTIALADNSSYKSFSIKAFEAVTNDDCATAENITVTTDSQTIAFEIGGASINNEEGCIGTTNDYSDIWYDFTMPVNGNLYVDGSLSWNRFALYDTCGGTEIQCGSSNQLFTGLTATTNYKLRLFRTLATTDNNSYRSFTIQAFEIIENDDCASSENIMVTENLTTVNFGIAGATVNNEIGCSGTPAEDYVDVWYDFTMPVNGSIVINGTIGWNNFAIYDACSGTELTCFSNSGNLSGLTNGTNYKLRLFRTLATADNNSFKSFTIQSSKTLSVNTYSLENSVQLYPNPAKDIIHISLHEDTSIETIELYDMLGKKVMETTNKTMNISSFQKGIYLVKISTNKGQITKRMVIQ